MKLHVYVVAVVACLLAQIAYPVSHSFQTSGSSWGTVFDPAALGSQYLTTGANARRAPDTVDDPRIARYRVTFDTAGTYDLYARLMIAPGAGNAGMYYSSNFGPNDNWVGVGANNLKDDAFGWVKLSDGGFTVDAPDTVLFSIASQRRGMLIDAFAFGATGATFTDEQLDAAALGNAAQSGLIGFQAQYANTFGRDTISDAGLELEKTFTEKLLRLRAELERHLPAIDPAKVAAWRASIEAEEEFAREAASTAQAVANMKGAEGNLRRLEEARALGPTTLEDAQERLVRARARGDDDPELEHAIRSAESFLEHRQRDVDRLERSVERARRAVEEAEANLPEAIKAAEAAQQAHERAMAAVLRAMDELGVSEVLGSDRLDNMLAQYMVLRSATPRGLAKFAAQSPDNLTLIRQLLGDTGRMVQMLVADGPNGGKYGQAMKIYTDIQQASPRAGEGVFQRLALAVSLGHAATIPRRDRDVSAGSVDDDEDDDTAQDGDDPSRVIDPVQRYLNYEQWYLAGELDIGFQDLCVWSLVMVVDGRDADETLAWGREMLHNLRPGFIPAHGDTSLYVDVVDAEIAYTSSGPRNDRPELQFMQNILANGGICGRRAFFGRFILRAFGVPTTARSEPGHATLAHWHPDGWRTRLGGSWGPGNRGRYARMNRRRSIPYGVDLNFLASTRARQDGDAFTRVKRAQWIGTLMGERTKPGFHPRGSDSNEEESSFWNDLALHEQRRIIAGLDAARGASSVASAAPAPAPGATGTITVDANGVITIPSAATSSPTESTRRLFRGHQPEILFFTKARAGDTRLHVSRYANQNDTFTYTFDAPRSGTYTMEARVATPRWDLSLHASANGGAVVPMPLPYTIGMWETSAPVEIKLTAGRNELTFHGVRVAIDHFTLTPVR